MRIFTVRFDVEVTVVVNNENVIDRCVNNEDGWRESFGNLDTAEKVVEQLAWNALMNGHGNARRLDGWADLDESAARMTVDRYAELLDVKETTE